MVYHTPPLTPLRCCLAAVTQLLRIAHSGSGEQHDDLMMTQVVICQLLRQQVTVRLSATRRTDTLMWCFVFTA